LGIIDHFLDVAQPVGPVEKIVAGERCGEFRIEFIEGCEASRPGWIIHASPALLSAALTLPALARAALTVALSWLIGLSILSLAGLRAFLSRLPAPAVLPIALLAASALLSGTLARTLTGARILVGLLGIGRIGILRLCIPLVVALTATILSAALGS